jgi:hypothetical protein
MTKAAGTSPKAPARFGAEKVSATLPRFGRVAPAASGPLAFPSPGPVSFEPNTYKSHYQRVREIVYPPFGVDRSFHSSE